MQYLAIAFWILMAGGQLAAAWATHAILPALLAAQSGGTVRLLLRRRFPVATAPLWGQLLAWGSVFLPLGLRVQTATMAGTMLSFSGLLLALWSMFTLGQSFGIAPADRGLVVRGPYRWIRHPMYAGELLSVVGALMGNLTIWNASLGMALLTVLVWRILTEERLIFGYSAYRQQVRWRLLPWVW